MQALLTLNRNRSQRALAQEPQWDVVIIGGGATGLGIAVDSASRGYKTLLLEGADFAKGTSSRSTKLVHGGVRYLAQGDIRLVYEALTERGVLLKNARHLVKRQPFVIPCYSVFAKLKFLTGLKIYDWLSGRSSFGSSRNLSCKEVIAALPGLQIKKLVGGVEYFDGQFDDARLAINLAQTATEQGAVLLNYFNVTAIKKKGSVINGVSGMDLETRTEHLIKAKVIINATGVFVDDIMRLDAPEKAPMVRPSQGIHLVFDATVLPGKKALMIPQTSDGRVLFAIPWHNKVLVGTTDTPLARSSPEPLALPAEIRFVLETLSQYLHKAPTEKDVRSVFAGLRPLAAPQKDTAATKEISRSHKIIRSESGLLTVTGGKWTTYRKMAEDAINEAIEIGHLPAAKCKTSQLRIHGSTDIPSANHLAHYGTDAPLIEKLMDNEPFLAEKLVQPYPYTAAEAVWAVRNEMARTVEDVLARRLRLLFLDAKAAVAAAPKVAALMAVELGLDQKWERSQVAAFNTVAAGYSAETLLTNNAEKREEVINLNF